VKFLDKYELLEPLTTGKVETFIARDLVANERVLIHFFGGGEHLTTQPSQEWALQALRGIAPPPLGAFREGGRYEQTSYCYLVTNFPADARAVRNWVRIYKLHSETTRDLGPDRVGAGQPKEAVFSEPVGEITKAFLRASTADLSASARVRSAQGRDRGVAQEEEKQVSGRFTGDVPVLDVSVRQPARATDGKEGDKLTSTSVDSMPGHAIPAAVPLNLQAEVNVPTQPQQKISTTADREAVPASLTSGSIEPSATPPPLPTSPAPRHYGLLTIAITLLILIALALLWYFALQH
jgi:hypothetical protein